MAAERKSEVPEKRRPKKAYRVEERWGMTKVLLVYADSREDAKQRVAHDPNIDNIEGIDTVDIVSLGFRDVRRWAEEDRDA